MKDFVSMAGPLNISHFLVFTKTDTAPYLRLMRLPRGPTITFKVRPIYQIVLRTKLAKTNLMVIVVIICLNRGC